MYRWLFFPRREPDFEHRLWIYWFDEKVAYGKLVSGKKKMELIEDAKGNLNYKQHYLETLFGDGELPLEVQRAYKMHVYKKFEEVILGSKAD